MDPADKRDALARLEALARSDKWYLSSGDGALWAPPTPRWLHRPGFWDGARLGSLELQPVFTVALVGADGAEEPLHRTSADWRPDRLRVRWRSERGLSFTEFRYLLGGGRFCSAWRTDEVLGWPNAAFRDRYLVAFTAVPGAELREVRARNGEIVWRRVLGPRGAATREVEQALAPHLFPPRGHRAVAPEVLAQLAQAMRDACCGAVGSEGSAEPIWDLTPFVESWPTPTVIEAPPDAPWIHLAATLPLGGLPARYGVGFVLRACPVPADRAGPAEPPPIPAPRPVLAEDRWCAALAAFPSLRCSDPRVVAYADYRVYGLTLNRLGPLDPHLPFPTVAEGIGPLHEATLIAAPCHMRETRWAADPDLTRGILRNFVRHQREDGSFPPALDLCAPPRPAAGLADFGAAVLAVHALHPRTQILETAYGALARYGGWLAARDPDDSGLVLVHEGSEVGQPDSPRWGDPAAPLHAVDAAVTAHGLWRALERMAGLLGYADEEAGWAARAERCARAVREHMWDEEAGLYRDCDAATSRRTACTALSGLSPLLTDIPAPAHVDRMLEHLRPGGCFHTPFPLPTLAPSDPAYSARGLAHGRRLGRAWNGRAWPAANSWVVEALLRHWHRGREEAGAMAADVLLRWIRMMCGSADAVRPRDHEHYNPETGHPSVFRGIDDHQRTWALDLVFRGIVGLDPSLEALRVHPLPTGLDRVAFSGHLRGRPVRVEIRGGSVDVTLDGHTHASVVGEPLEIPW